MTQAQKIIKYLAIAFAIFLIVSIFSGIYIGVSAILGVNDALSEGKTVQTDVSEDITKLEIDIRSAELEFVTGEEFSVSADEKYITVSDKDGKLKINEKSRGLFAVKGAGKVTITVPEGTRFECAEIDSGAGTVKLENISTDVLELDLGAGEVSIDGLTVTKSAEIDGGAGKITVENSEINDLDMDMGVGELDLEALLSGSSTIDFGVGKAEVVLKGSAEDYRLRIDKGLGSAELEGEDMESATYYGDGESRVDMEGGVGNISIRFAE